MQYEEISGQARRILSCGQVDSAGNAESLLRAYVPGAPTKRDRGMALEFLAETLTMQNRIPEAMEVFRSARRLIEDPVDLLAWFSGMCDAVVRGRLFGEVHALRAELERFLTTNGAVAGRAISYGYRSMADMSLLVGEADKAITYGKQAVQCAMQNECGRAEAHSCLSEALEAAGDVLGAMDALEVAMTFMVQGHCLLEARARHSKLALKCGERQKATNSLMRAVEFPDLRDRIVLAEVLEAMVDLGEVDPEAQQRCLRSLAGHLRGTARKGCEERR